MVKVKDTVELIEIKDKYTHLKKGDRGVVTSIDEKVNQVWVDWNNGEKLALLTDVDKFKVV